MKPRRGVVSGLDVTSSQELRSAYSHFPHQGLVWQWAWYAPLPQQSCLSCLPQPGRSGSFQQRPLTEFSCPETWLLLSRQADGRGATVQPCGKCCAGLCMSPGSAPCSILARLLFPIYTLGQTLLYNGVLLGTSEARDLDGGGVGKGKQKVPSCRGGRDPGSHEPM